MNKSNPFSSSAPSKQNWTVIIDKLFLFPMAICMVFGLLTPYSTSSDYIPLVKSVCVFRTEQNIPAATWPQGTSSVAVSLSSWEWRLQSPADCVDPTSTLPSCVTWNELHKPLCSSASLSIKWGQRQHLPHGPVKIKFVIYAQHLEQRLT